MNPNIEFYEKMKELQNIQHSNEEKRTELEHQLNTYVRSDKRLAKLKAVRLQSYWKKVCEDERKSQWRNEQLLRDFDRVEAHMEDLQSRTEKLRTMKKRFEDHVESVYPNWKEKVLFYQKLRQHQDNLDRNKEAEEIRKAAVNAMNAQSATSALFSQPQQPVVNNVGVTTGNVHSQSHSISQYPEEVSDIRVRVTEQPVHSTSQYDGQYQGQYEMGSTIPTLSTIPTGTGGLSTGFSGRSIQATSTPHPGHQIETKQLPYSRIEEESPRRDHYQNDTGIPEEYGVSPRPQSKQHPSVASDTRETTQTPTTQVTQKQVNTFMEPAEQSEVYSYRSNPKSPSPRNPKENKHEIPDKTDDLEDSDLGSVEDIPQSVSETPRLSDPKLSKPELQAQQSLDNSRSIYADPEVTLSGLYSILSAVSEHVDSPAARSLYRGDRPAESVHAEIIGNANRGAALNYIDSTSLSMVVLDQLPLLVNGTVDRCILPDSILFKFPPVISETAISDKIAHTSRVFWDKLLEHFIELAKHRVMKTQEIAEIFAPLIIANDSPYESKATELLYRLLDECVPEDLPSPNSTSTFSATPRRTPQVLIKKHSSDEEEDFFEQVPPKEVHTAALTQSAAYRQMLGSTVSTQKSVSYIESDEEDDIERQVASPRPGNLNNQGSFKKSDPIRSGTTSPKVTASPVRDGALSPASITSGMSSPAPLSPKGFGGAGGYVPSSLGDTGRSGVGQSTISSMGSTGKKPAFMYGGDSDTDEDIDLPGTEQRNDDFDFYD